MNIKINVIKLLLNGYQSVSRAQFKVRNLKSFIAKRVISHFVNLRYFWLKLLKYKENIQKICDTFWSYL